MTKHTLTPEDRAYWRPQIEALLAKFDKLRPAKSDE